ncbi:E3 ubiquitin-protein ligase RNF169 [Erpetoichthys calabaricus]|uniref:RING-type E3 ubiquitin transferase n=1 Tax=Erpetoichthys calabaricus TaxID=27687 RepID=A0A8C4RV51_ERPCA|nr:E3 ubiquitin-protein ligase RNF169 [Erpetoichthys calabaricus]
MAALSSVESSVRPKAVRRGRRAGGATRELTLEEAICPVCLEIFLEPVTMPCRHSVCLPCFQRTVELSSLRCPLCRLRVSSWARRRTRDRTLINAELWELVRRSHPERCRRRMEGQDGEAVKEELIFRTPVHISKPGEMRQEYEKQIKKLEEEKQEDRASEELIQKILEDDRRHLDKVRYHQILQRKEEWEYLQNSHEPVCVVLSDSENEEPVGGKGRHLSAFVRKVRSPSSSGKRFQRYDIQRSQSCTDSEEVGKAKNRCPLHTTPAAKSLVSFTPNNGILLSSENSRSFSAPNLTSDKRNSWRSGSCGSGVVATPLLKTERSISPESNDSISEELNHFKPIVCSPCTPPKRLPDGRVVEPTIVKSTPRNLTRSLQKHTSYEASPSILQKWKQIEQDRLNKKASSKGTTTSMPAEEFSKDKHCTRESVSLLPDTEKQSVSGCVTLDNGLSKSSSNYSELHESHNLSCKSQTLFCKTQRLIIDHPAEGHANVLHNTEKDQLLVKFKPIQVTCESSFSHSGPQIPHSKRLDTKNLILLTAEDNSKNQSCEKDSHATLISRKLFDPVERTDYSDSSDVSNTKHKPTKRSQKTKHLEGGEKAKRLRTSTREGVGSECQSNSFDGFWLQKEDEDRKLAIKLQQQFDLEYKTVERQKGTPDNYLLRSWATSNSQLGHSPRRSGRNLKKT